MSQELDKVIQVLNTISGTMEGNNSAITSAMSSLAQYRTAVTDDVQAGAGAMNKSAEAMIMAMETMKTMSEMHAKGQERLGNKIDKHTEVVTSLLTDLARIMSEQKGMSLGIQQICKKIDLYESTLSDHSTRITVIEQSSIATQGSNRFTTTNVISIATALFVLFGGVVAWAVTK